MVVRTAPWRLVSHMDVVAAIATGQYVLAHEVAATEARTISAGDPLERAAQMMTEHAVSHLVVVDPSGGYPRRDDARRCLSVRWQPALGIQEESRLRGPRPR